MKTTRLLVAGAMLALAVFVPQIVSAFQPGGCPGMGC